MVKYFSRHFCILLLILCVSLLSAHELSFEKEAHVWSKKIIKQEPSQEELTFLLNILYFSEQRSADIIRMQHAVASYVAAASSILNDAISSRRNPAKITSITGYQTSQWDASACKFDEAHVCMKLLLERYRADAAAYAQCLEYLIKKNGIRSELLFFIEELREDSRCAMMRAMQTNATSLQRIKDTLKKIMRTFSVETRALEDEITESITRGIVDCLANFAAPAAIASYVKLDQRYNQFNEIAWRSLVMGYEVDNLLWDMLEEVRIDFYHTYYTTLAQVARENNVMPERVFVAFSADGVIMPGMRTVSLPLSV